MGLYDTVKIKLYCPFCKHPSKEWQTKDLWNTMAVYSFKEAKKELFEKINPMIKFTSLEVHDVCAKCDRYVSIALACEKDGD